MKQHKSIIIEKNKPPIFLVLFIISIVPPAFTMGLIVYHEFNTPSLIVGLLFSPVFLFFLKYAYKVISMINNKITLSDSGIIIEDYRVEEFKWSDIVSFSLQGFKTRAPDDHCFLYLKTNNQSDLKEHMLTMTSEDLEDGFIVCDISKYLVKQSLFKEKFDSFMNNVEKQEKTGGLLVSPSIAK
jgi:hypothetical protein